MTEPVKPPIEDLLDLHTFLPREVPDLLDDYFAECVKTGIFAVRVIHGKGSGTLKKRVQSLLKRHPLVAGFKDAPADAGGWGATLVELKQKPARPLTNSRAGHTP
ncbi:MAG: Smr/MutS family protein [Desulfobacterales bacterium]